MNKILIIAFSYGCYLLAGILDFNPFSQNQVPDPLSVKRPTASELPQLPVRETIQTMVRAVTVDGEAFVADEEKKSLLKEGMDVPDGAMIITNKNAFVNLVLKDNSTVNLSENSKLTVAGVQKKSTSKAALDLHEGMMRTNVKEQLEEEYFQIKTKDAVITTQAAEIITIVKNDVTEIITLSGFIDVFRTGDSRGIPLRDQEKIILGHNSLDHQPEAVMESEMDYYQNNYQPRPEVPASPEKTVDVGDRSFAYPHENSDEIAAIAPENKLNINQPYSGAIALNYAPGLSPLKPVVGEVLREEKASPLVPANNVNLGTETEHVSIYRPTNDPQTQVDLVTNNVIDESQENKSNEVPQLEYVKVVDQLVNDPETQTLPPQEKEDLIELATATTIDKVNEFIENDYAAVLITPDNKVVYFEDFPELKEELPKDDQGEVIGIQVDYNLNPINTVPTDGAAENTLTQVEQTAIPVVGPTGEVFMLPVLNEADQSLVVIPTISEAQVAGISTEILGDDEEWAEEEIEVSGKKTKKLKKVKKIKKAKKNNIS